MADYDVFKNEEPQIGSWPVVLIAFPPLDGALRP